MLMVAEESQIGYHIFYSRVCNHIHKLPWNEMDGRERGSCVQFRNVTYSYLEPKAHQQEHVHQALQGILSQFVLQEPVPFESDLAFAE